MIQVRRATPQDVETIASFNEAMALETEAKVLDPATIRAGVGAVFEDPGHGFYLVAERDGAAVGCLLITREWSDWRNGLFWWIQSVFIPPEARRQGVYRRLYEAARAMASEAGVIGFRLYVETENTRAQQTYAALGMTECRYRMFEAML